MFYIFPCTSNGYEYNFPIGFAHPASCMGDIPLGDVCLLQYTIDCNSTKRGRFETLDFYRARAVDGVISKDDKSASGYSLTVTSYGHYSGMTVEAYPDLFTRDF